MNKQVHFEFEDLDGQLHEVGIYTDGNLVRPLIEGKSGGNGYEIEHRASEENQFNRIWLSELSMSWMALDAGHIAVYNDIVSSDIEYWVEVSIDGNVKWKGEIIKDFNQIENTPFPRELTIQAKDGLSKLFKENAEILFKPTGSLQFTIPPVPQVFCNGLETIQKTGLTDSTLVANFFWTDERLRFGGYDENFNYFGALLAAHPIGLKNGEETREVIEDTIIRRVGGRDDENNILTGGGVVNSRTFIQTEKIRDTFYEVGEVFNAYLERLDLIMFYDDNKFYVLQRDNMRDVNIKAWEFDLDYTPSINSPFFGTGISAINLPRSTNPFGRIVYASTFNAFPKANKISHTLVPTINPEVNRVEKIDNDNFYRNISGNINVDYYKIIENINNEFGNFAVIFRLYGEYDLPSWGLQSGSGGRPIPHLDLRIKFDDGVEQYHYNSVNKRWVLTTGSAGFATNTDVFGSYITNFTRIREFSVEEVPSINTGDVEIQAKLRYFADSVFFNRYRNTNPQYWIGTPQINGELNGEELSNDFTFRSSVQGLALAILPNGNQTQLVRSFELSNQTRSGVIYDRSVLHYDNNGNYLPQYRVGRGRNGQSDPFDEVFGIDTTWGRFGENEELSLNDLSQREMAEGVYRSQEGLEAEIKQRIPLWHRVNYDGKIYRWLGRRYMARENKCIGQLIQIIPRTGVQGSYPGVGIEPLLRQDNRTFGSPGQIQGDIQGAFTVAVTDTLLNLDTSINDQTVTISSLSIKLTTGMKLNMLSPSGSFLGEVVVDYGPYDPGDDITITLQGNNFNDPAPPGSVLSMSVTQLFNNLSAMIDI